MGDFVGPCRPDNGASRGETLWANPQGGGFYSMDISRRDPLGDSAGRRIVLSWELVQRGRAIPEEGPSGAIPQEGVLGKQRSRRVLDGAGSGWCVLVA